MRTLEKCPASNVTDSPPCRDFTPAKAPDAAVASGTSSTDFDRIYEDHFSFVWRSLRALGLRDASLDDAAQDVFLVVHRRLPEFDGRSSLRTWIFAIVEHVAFNHRRSMRRKLSQLTTLDETHPSHEPGPLERAQDREMAEFLSRFLDGLTPDQRILFVLALVEQIPMPEVADMIGIPLNTAYTRIRALKQAFRKAISAGEERAK